jgi:hypothetical protein
MIDWFHNLPIVWMALLVFAFTYLLSALIYFVVTVLAVGDRARAFKSVMAPAPARRSTVRLAH